MTPDKSHLSGVNFYLNCLFTIKDSWKSWLFSWIVPSFNLFLAFINSIFCFKPCYNKCSSSSICSLFDCYKCNWWYRIDFVYLCCLLAYFII